MWILTLTILGLVAVTEFQIRRRLEKLGKLTNCVLFWSDKSTIHIFIYISFYQVILYTLLSGGVNVYIIDVYHCTLGIYRILCDIVRWSVWVFSCVLWEMMFVWLFPRYWLCFNSAPSSSHTLSDVTLDVRQGLSILQNTFSLYFILSLALGSIFIGSFVS